MNVDTGLVRSARRLRDAAEARPHGGSREIVLRSERFWAQVRLALDVALLGAAAVVAEYAATRQPSLGEKVLWPLLFATIVCYLSYRRGSYSRRVKIDALDDEKRDSTRDEEVAEGPTYACGDAGRPGEVPFRGPEDGAENAPAVQGQGG